MVYLNVHLFGCWLLLFSLFAGLVGWFVEFGYWYWLLLCLMLDGYLFLLGLYYLWDLLFAVLFVSGLIVLFAWYEFGLYFICYYCICVLKFGWAIVDFIGVCFCLDVCWLFEAFWCICLLNALVDCRFVCWCLVWFELVRLGCLLDCWLVFIWGWGVYFWLFFEDWFVVWLALLRLWVWLLGVVWLLL